MFVNSKLLLLALCFTLALNYAGCMKSFFTPEAHGKLNPPMPKVEKQTHDRGVDPGKKNQENTKDAQTPPPLEKNPPDIMATYDRAVALDKQGKVDEAYELYEEFLNSVPKVERPGIVEDPKKKEERKKAIENAKKRINELAKFKEEEQPKPVAK
ncbi:hypothetical protein KKB18_12125 [bacterium]|nr:hypothetical protein [bacterium]